MPIHLIRVLQRVSQFLLLLGPLSAVALVAVEAFEDLLLPAMSMAMGGGLMAILTRLRCGVCGAVFIGREERHFFTPTCMNCGRRAGDYG